jgi:sulfur-oxidizing protein SoxZ
MANSRVKVPASAKAGDNLEIRAMIMHPMENGYNVDTQGTTIPVHIITDFVCTYDGAEVVHIQLQPGLSANPYFSFYLTASKSGPVDFTWTDQDGTITTNSATLLVT